VSPPASLTTYRLASGLIEPFAPAMLRGRARRGREDPARLGERLGRASIPRPSGRLAWLHGASVGEALSLVPLAGELIAARDDLSVLVTAGTRTAAELLAQRLPPGAIHQYAPVDGPAATARFLDHWRPDLGVFVESELWPNLLMAARARRLRMALLSAKLSDSSLRGWSRFPSAANALLDGFDLVLAQDARAAERLSSLGAKVGGLADLKFGAPPLPADPEKLAALKSATSGRPVILAASTHPGEDEVVLQSFAALPAGPLLVIVPRHPERGGQIAAMANAAGLSATRQGAGEPFGSARVHIADALGELGLWYRVATLAFIGGGWAEDVGGHNPLEPARLGCPFVSGPHVENWRSAYAGLIEADATHLVEADAIGGWLGQAAAGAPSLCAMADRAKAFAAARDAEARGVVQRLLVLLP
jgi:3-deoxy-D-manno-octulosonic-acid transferase